MLEEIKNKVKSAKKVKRSNFTDKNRLNKSSESHGMTKIAIAEAHYVMHLDFEISRQRFHSVYIMYLIILLFICISEIVILI